MMMINFVTTNIKIIMDCSFIYSWKHSQVRKQVFCRCF